MRCLLSLLLNFDVPNVRKIFEMSIKKKNNQIFRLVFRVYVSN